MNCRLRCKSCLKKIRLKIHRRMQKQRKKSADSSDALVIFYERVCLVCILSVCMKDRGGLYP